MNREGHKWCVAATRLQLVGFSHWFPTGHRPTIQKQNTNKPGLKTHRFPEYGLEANLIQFQSPVTIVIFQKEENRVRYPLASRFIPTSFFFLSFILPLFLSLGLPLLSSIAQPNRFSWDSLFFFQKQLHRAGINE